MQIQTICVLVTVFCASISSAQRQNRGGGGGRRQRDGGGGEGPGRGGGWGEGPLGDSGPVISALMNDPFAVRRWFHPLANQRFMNAFYQPNIATLSLMMDMEPMDALLFGALSGGVAMPARGRRRQQFQPDPLLVALGIGDGLDAPDPGRGGQGGGGRRGRPKRPVKARGRAKAKAPGGAKAKPRGGRKARGRTEAK